MGSGNASCLKREIASLKNQGVFSPGDSSLARTRSRKVEHSLVSECASEKMKPNTGLVESSSPKSLLEIENEFLHSRKRFTRSAMKTLVGGDSGSDSKGVSLKTPVVGGLVDGKVGQGSKGLEKPQSVRVNFEAGVDNQKIDEERLAKEVGVKESLLEIQNENLNSPKRFTRAARKSLIGVSDSKAFGEGASLETPIVVEEVKEKEGGFVGKPVRGVTCFGEKFMAEGKVGKGSEVLEKPEHAKLNFEVSAENQKIDKEKSGKKNEANVEKSKWKDEANAGVSNLVVDADVWVANASVRKSERRITRTALRSMGEVNVISNVQNASQETKNASLQKPQSTQSNSEVIAKAHRISEEKSTRNDEADVGMSNLIVDDNGGMKNDIVKKPERRITRTALRSVGDVKVTEVSKGQNTSQEEPQYFCFNLETMVEPHKHNMGKSTREEEAYAGNPKSIEDNNRGLMHALVKKSEKLVTRSASRTKACLFMFSEAFVPGEEQTASPLKPLKRLNRSASKIESMVLDTSRKEQNGSLEKTSQGKAKVQLLDGNVHNASHEKTLKCCTRSAWVEKAEPVVVPLADTPSGSSDSTELEDVHGNGIVSNTDDRTAGVISRMRTPLKKKLEMKMSKKITLNNPSKVRELLQTGMLEGLLVRYIFGDEKNEGLKGIIKDCGILCFCSLCKGCKVINPIQFERHAGSTNRSPADHIFLDNGKSLLDVLNACKDAPLDMLEVTIQNAINSSTVNNVICLLCKRPLPVYQITKKMPLCHACLKLKTSEANSVCSASSTASRLAQPIMTPESTARELKRKSKQSENNRKKCRYSEPILTLIPCDTPLNCIPSHNQSQGRITRKDTRLHSLVFEENGLPDGTELTYVHDGMKLKEGYKMGSEIVCTCCSKLMSPSRFENHAGHGRLRKPYMHIYTSNGVSLHELSVSLSKERKFSSDDNDDLCSICAEVGKLLLCDGCPRSFHKECVGVPNVPKGKWYCPCCQNVFEREKFGAQNANAKAAGRVAGVDPIEQITRRCIRIVNTPEIDVGGCNLCRCPDFRRSEFGPRTVIICDQCEREYHVGCLKDHDMDDLKELPEGKWFCTTACGKVNSTLQRLIDSPPEKMHVVVKQNNNNCSNNVLVTWKFLCGKSASPESRSLLSEAVAIFHESFDPIVDSVTGCDLIPSMVYGENTRSQDYGGMFCAVLMLESSIVSAGILRVFGQEVSELPLVATSNGYQGKGYFQSLFSCIVKLLSFMHVKKLVLPAAHEAEAIWTTKFGFEKMNDGQIKKYKRDFQLTNFQGTSMLQMAIPKCRVIRK